MSFLLNLHVSLMVREVCFSSTETEELIEDKLKGWKVFPEIFRHRALHTFAVIL
jgi:hypothetical protein